MLNWKTLAANYVNRITQWNGDKNGAEFLPWCITCLREMTGAYSSMQLVFEDKLTARVKDAEPSFLNDMILNPEPVKELLQTYSDQPFCWADIPVKQNVFEELLVALSSAVIIPVRYHRQSALLILGWSEPQQFGADFSVAALSIKTALENALTQHSKTEGLERSNAYLSAILEAMSQAVVFIDDNGYSGWLNKPAARLLKLSLSGEMPPSDFAGAMAQWRNTATNVADINREAAQYFATPGYVIKDWLWHFDTPEKATYRVSCMPLKTAMFTGRLWVFDNITAFVNAS